MITRQSPGTIRSQHETKKTIIPNQCATIEAGINLRTLTNTTGTTHWTEQYPGDNQIVVASSNSTTSNSKTEMRVTNTSPNPFTLKDKTTVAEFLILSPKKAKQLQPLNSAALKVLADDNSVQALEYVDELLDSSEKPQNVPKLWFPTLENLGDPSSHPPIQN